MLSFLKKIFGAKPAEPTAAPYKVEDKPSQFPFPKTEPAQSAKKAAPAKKAAKPRTAKKPKSK